MKLKVACALMLSMALGVVGSAGTLFAMTEYFVSDSTGNDAWDGKSDVYVSGDRGPKKTIQAAVGLADGNGTIVTVLPGDYQATDEDLPNLKVTSTWTTEGDARVYFYQTNLIYIAKDNVKLRSRSGRDQTRLIGRHGTGRVGASPDSIRCIEVYRYSTNVVVEGFTICNGGTANTGGGGVMGASDSYTYVIDCVITNNLSDRGAVRYCNVFGSILADNGAWNRGNAAMDSRLSNCLVIRNNRYGATALSTIPLMVNCTVADNHASKYAFDYGGGPIWNSIIVEHNTGNGFSPSQSYDYTLHRSIAQRPAHYKEIDAFSETNDTSDVYYASPCFDDWRLLPGTKAIGLGDVSALDLLPLPEGYVHKDAFGNVIDTNAVLHAGAVQTVMTPAGGRLTFKDKVEIAGFPAMAGAHGWWIVPETWPITYRVRPVTANMLRSDYYGIFAQEESEATRPKRRRFRFPLYDGWIRLVPPRDTATNLTMQAQLVQKVYYVDDEKGDDENDGLSPEPGAAGTGPFKTLTGAAEKTEAENAGYSLVYVAPGVYDEKSHASFDGEKRVVNRLYINGADDAPRGFISTVPHGAVIKGEPDPSTGGLGPEAIRGVYVHQYNAFLQGFDITGCWTPANDNGISRGAAARCDYLNQLLDCVISNNFAYEEGGTHGGVILRTKFFDNYAYQTGQTRSSTLLSCVFAGNWSEDRNVCPFYSSSAWFTTVDAGGFTAMRGQKESLGCVIANSRDKNNPDMMIDSVYGGEMWFADAAARDYRLGACSPALQCVSVENYGLDWQSIFNPTDVDGNDFVWTDGKMRAGAYLSVPPAPTIIIGAANGGIEVLEGAQVGTNVFSSVPASITVRATTTETRPYVGIAVNGEIRTTAVEYTFAPSVFVDGLMTVTAVYGTDWYVNCAPGIGDDANSGATPEEPKRTLAGAARLAVSGDTIHVAPGIYDAESMIHSVKSWSGTHDITIRSRVCLGEGVTMMSDEGAEKTVILGQAATEPDAYGNGSDAMRCVQLEPNSRISGFTLTGGHSAVSAEKPTARDDNSGAGVLARDAATSLVTDCIVTNNTGSRHVAGLKCTFVRSVIAGNRSNSDDSRAPAGQGCRYYGCYVDRNIGTRTVESFYAFESCTLGPDNKTSTGGNPEVLDYPACTVTNSLLLPRKVNAALKCHHCALRDDIANLDAANVTDSIVTNLASLAIDERGRPQIGSNVAIDAADESVPATPDESDVDLYGSPRVMNGARDIGAVEYDWRGQFARAVWGTRADVQAVPSAAKLVDEGFLLPSGAVSGQFARDGEFVLHFAIGGTGTLRFFVNDALVGECGGQETSFALGAVRRGDSYRIAYEPGAGSDAGVRFGRATSNVGMLLIVR